MISFKGYDQVIERVMQYGQEHVFRFWDELSDHEKKNLLDDLSTVDFELLITLYRQAKEKPAHSAGFEPSPYIPLPSNAEEREIFEAARRKGVETIRAGKVAAFVVAGGQGSRLGYEGPKGMFRIGPVSDKSLFQIHAEKIVKYSRKYGISIPWLIMTSESNHASTAEYLRRERYFGLSEADVIIFPQNMIPSLDLHGKLILESRDRIFKNPDGHGGSLTALRTSGALAKMEKRGIEIISYFQVDNPLVNIIDPVFTGFHVQNGADISSKGLMKAYPGEKIGVFVKFSDGSIGVMEYSDLPPELQNARDGHGRLTYCMGSIAIHLFNTAYIGRITGGSLVSLPFHIAQKKITAFTAHGPAGIEGYKFEKFVFDALPLTDKNVVLEIAREDEFAPVKNKTGIDSVDTAQDLMTKLSLRWLKERGVPIPANVKVVEISPLLAVEPKDIPDSITVPDTEKVYLE